MQASPLTLLRIAEHLLDDQEADQRSAEQRREHITQRRGALRRSTAEPPTPQLQVKAPTRRRHAAMATRRVRRQSPATTARSRSKRAACSTSRPTTAASGTDAREQQQRRDPPQTLDTPGGNREPSRRPTARVTHEQHDGHSRIRQRGDAVADHSEPRGAVTHGYRAPFPQSTTSAVCSNTIKLKIRLLCLM